MLTSNDSIRVRIRLVAIFFVFAFCALFYRLYIVQIGRHAELYRKAKNQYTAKKTEAGKRGEIFDCNGNLLVGNVPCDDISIDPWIVGDATTCRKIAAMFSKYLKIDFDVVYGKLMRKTRKVKTKEGKRIVRRNRYAVIAREVPLKISSKLKRIIKVNEFLGIFFREKYSRYYPKKNLLSNVLGFTNEDHGEIIAVLGVEKFFNKQMSSSKSVMRFERARDGRPLIYGAKESIKARNGLNVYLTISEPLQSILEEELDKMVAEWKPTAAYAIMADPKTGNILAMAQRPSFNPNDRRSMDPKAWRNRICADYFEPGSTMKPVAVAGALDYGIVTPGMKFNCEKGRWKYGGKILKDAHPMDVLTVSQILQKSSNIGIAKIALMMGEKRLYRVFRKFGFGSYTGIPLKPETRGALRPINRWDTLSITRFPIGQGVGTSPLQMVRAYCALADHGRLRKLRLVDKIEDTQTGLVIRNPIKKPLQVFHDPTTWGKVIDMMCMVTEAGGTARRVAIEGYEIAGKTGTSQKFINGAYSHSKYIASFIGFMPAHDPQIVLLVAADEPHGSIYGGRVAGPTFRNIALRALRYLNIKPDPELMKKRK
ncbi:MAG: penicillin-binding protein 2 [Lentisphaerae bacterium]|nr:penicillin-binding protein 2 [Lentisphaerota bacterium]MCP4099833.1 penicillin-binding protein 2 [Lentisphaerota bacterium]